MYQSSKFQPGDCPSPPGGNPPFPSSAPALPARGQALLFAQAGHDVTLHERSDAAMMLSTSHWAGGMLAPYCETECAEPVIVRLGLRSLDLWRAGISGYAVQRFAGGRRSRATAPTSNASRGCTSGHRRLDAGAMAELEPSLQGRFREGLFFADEGHVEPRRMLPKLHARFVAAGGTIKFNSEPAPADIDGIAIDCRGLSARDIEPGLRGVKGEIILIETDEVELARPVRLIHPRWPLDVIPREDQSLHAGRDLDRGRGYRRQRPFRAGTARRRLCGHPAFAEARIVEFGSGLRPAFPDNLPRIAIGKNTASRSTGFIRTAS